MESGREVEGIGVKKEGWKDTRRKEKKMWKAGGKEVEGMGVKKKTSGRKGIRREDKG